jgi:hypothetical protein
VRESRRRSGSRLAAGTLAVSFSLLVALLVGAGPVGAAETVAHAPRVVIVVGPSGAATNRYRDQARDAAVVARRFTEDVVEVYSPNATWPAVRAALQGASVVIYMGHGNGWPSPYRDSLYPPSQNGFGLNPRAGVNDTDHQYFGEAAIGSKIRLAPDAVVLLNHLCYASGNAEPGIAEGTLATARQRVDNFAAGFIRAGASAVIADAYASPTAYLASILGGGRSVESIWRRATDANGNAFAFDSRRSPGFIAQMDPETATSGFSRSIVLRAGLTPREVRAGARGSVPVVGPSIPGLVATGVRFATPDIALRPAAGSRVRMDLPYKLPRGAALPKGLEASVRWTPIDLQTAPSPKPGPSSSATPEQPIPGLPGEVGTPPLAPPQPPDELDLVVPESAGDVVAPTLLKARKGGLALAVAMPAVPGRYRLTVTLHSADGVAFDAATQALLPSLDVRVTGDLDGAVLAAPAMTLTAGSAVDLPVRVTNLGKRVWGTAAVLDPTGGTIGRPATTATIVGWWLPTGGPVDPTALAPGLAPGATTDASVAVIVPRTPGAYVLVMDIVTPVDGSLMAAGVDPTLVLVTVVAPK